MLIASTFVDTKNWYGIDNEFPVTGFPYDWGSISHYSVNTNDPQMIPRVGISVGDFSIKSHMVGFILQAPGVDYLGAGPTDTLSAMDATKINAMYGCDCP
jgi:hypothetical protein